MNIKVNAKTSLKDLKYQYLIGASLKIKMYKTDKVNYFWEKGLGIVKISCGVQ